jgi:hypothetical protein
MSEFFHANFEILKKLSNKRVNGFPIPVYCVGPQGTSKTTTIKQMAKEKNLRYGFLPCNGQTSKSDIMGFTDAMGVKRESMFQDMYVNGGLFVFEEIDAVHADTIVVVNTMIDSDEASFNNQMFKRHKDFHIYATANTYSGANDAFTARKQLDQSTLERFAKVEFQVDLELEKNIFGIDAYLMIQKIRIKLLNQEYFSTRQAKMFLAMRELGLISALKSTALRNTKSTPDIKIIKNLFEEYLKSDKNISDYKVIDFDNMLKYKNKIMEEIPQTLIKDY